MEKINFYQIIFVFSIIILVLNLKKTLALKKENMETLYVIKFDNRSTRLLGLTLFIVSFVSLTFLLIEAISNDMLTSNEIIQAISIVLLFIGVYLPIVRKTKLTDKGILKNNSLIKWKDIKSIEYRKPNKGKYIVKLNYNTKYNRPLNSHIAFSEKNIEELEKFKEIAKQYRKKGRKKNRKKNKS